MRLLPRDFEPALKSIAPGLTAILTFAAGVMLLISGETPSEHDRVVWLLQYFPPWVLNLSHFVSSLLGLVLVLLAWGLRERLGAAWMASVIVAALACGARPVQGGELGGDGGPGRPGGAARLLARRVHPPRRPLQDGDLARLDALGSGDGRRRPVPGPVVVQERRLLRPALVAGDGRRRRGPRAAGGRGRGRAAAGLRGLADDLDARDPAGDRRGRPRLHPCARHPGLRRGRPAGRQPGPARRQALPVLRKRRELHDVRGARPFVDRARRPDRQALRALGPALALPRARRRPRRAAGHLQHRPRRPARPDRHGLPSAEDRRVRRRAARRLHRLGPSARGAAPQLAQGEGERGAPSR